MDDKTNQLLDSLINEIKDKNSLDLIRDQLF